MALVEFDGTDGGIPAGLATVLFSAACCESVLPSFAAGSELEFSLLISGSLDLPSFSSCLAVGKFSLLFSFAMLSVLSGETAAVDTASAAANPENTG